MAEAIRELKESLKVIKPNQESQWFKLFERVVITLLFVLGSIIGLNLDTILK